MEEHRTLHPHKRCALSGIAFLSPTGVPVDVIMCCAERRPGSSEQRGPVAQQDRHHQASHRLRPAHTGAQLGQGAQGSYNTKRVSVVLGINTLLCLNSRRCLYQNCIMAAQGKAMNCAPLARQCGAEVGVSHAA